MKTSVLAILLFAMTTGPALQAVDSKPTPDAVISALQKLRGFDSQRKPRIKLDNNGAVVALELPPGTTITSTVLGYLKSLSELEILYLEAAVDLRDAGLKHLKGLSKLKGLDLSVGYVSDAGLQHLIGLPKLEMLRVSNTYVTGAGLAQLKKIKTLIALDISRCKGLTDANIVHLKSMTNLRALDLTNAKITDAGLEHLKGLKKLERLDLSLISTITPAGVSKLQRALPGCEINKPVF